MVKRKAEIIRYCSCEVGTCQGGNSINCANKTVPVVIDSDEDEQLVLAISRAKEALSEYNNLEKLTDKLDYCQHPKWHTLLSTLVERL